MMAIVDHLAIRVRCSAGFLRKMMEDEMKIDVIKETDLAWIVKCSTSDCEAGITVSKSYTPVVNGIKMPRITRTTPEARYCVSCGFVKYVKK